MKTFLFLTSFSFIIAVFFFDMKKLLLPLWIALLLLPLAGHAAPLQAEKPDCQDVLVGLFTRRAKAMKLIAGWVRNHPDETLDASRFGSGMDAAIPIPYALLVGEGAYSLGNEKEHLRLFDNPEQAWTAIEKALQSKTARMDPTEAIENILGWIADRGSIPTRDEMRSFGLNITVLLRSFQSSSDFWLAVQSAGTGKNIDVPLRKVVVENPSPEFREAVRQEVLLKITQWMQKNAAQPITLAQVARIAGVAKINRLVSSAEYAQGRLRYPQRIFDSAFDLWLALKRKSEDVELPFRLYPIRTYASDSVNNSSKIFREELQKEAALVLLNNLAATPDAAISSSFLDASGYSKYALLGYKQSSRAQAPRLFRSKRALLQALLKGVPERFSDDAPLRKRIESSLQKQLLSNTDPRDPIDIESGLNETPAAKATPDSPGAAVRPLWQQEAVQHVLDWLKRPENRNTRPNRFQWSNGGSQMANPIPVNYDRLVGRASYALGESAYDRRIFDNTFQAWMAIHEAAAKEGIDVPLRFLTLYGPAPQEFTDLLQKECVQAVAKFAAQTGPHPTMSQITKILNISARKLFYDPKRIFSSPEAFYEMLTREITPPSP